MTSGAPDHQKISTLYNKEGVTVGEVMSPNSRSFLFSVAEYSNTFSVTGGATIGQTFSVTDNKSIITGGFITLLTSAIANYGITVTLYQDTTKAVTLASTTISKSDLNQYSGISDFFYFFSPIQLLKGEGYYIEFSIDSSETNNFSFYKNINNMYPEGDAYLNGTKQSGVDLAMGIHIGNTSVTISNRDYVEYHESNRSINASDSYTFPILSIRGKKTVSFFVITSSTNMTIQKQISPYGYWSANQWDSTITIPASKKYMETFDITADSFALKITNNDAAAQTVSVYYAAQ